MKTLEEIETLLNEKNEAHQAKVQDLADKVTKAENKLEQAKADMLKAEDNADLESYKKAKDLIWSAKAEKEMYTKLHKKAENKKVFSEEDYNALTKKILSNAEEINDAQIKEMIEPVRALKKIAKANIQMQKNAQALLEQLQSMNKANPVTITPTGGKNYSALPYIRIDNSARGYYDTTIGNGELSKIAGTYEDTTPRLAKL